MKKSTQRALGYGAVGVAALGIAYLWWRQSGISLSIAGALPPGVAGPPGAQLTRASCIECTQKHLGAALVLITEARDGYPHRLRAIGHLHEAEDESQAWPELHAAIRAARKNYQQQGVTPDFDALESLSNAVRARAA